MHKGIFIHTAILLVVAALGFLAGQDHGKLMMYEAPGEINGSPMEALRHASH